MVSKNHSVFIIGLALFSMFFGSGNLIFPLYVGELAQQHSLSGILGFGLTGVLVPFLGIVAMVVYEGDYTRFFSLLGKSLGFAVTLILLTVWIPLGSGPRCVILAFSSLSSQANIPMPPLWLFSIVYSFFVYMVVQKKSRIIDILGKVLTPLLLLCIGILVFQGKSAAPEIAPMAKLSPQGVFFMGLQEGYNTMDLIASFFFSASVIRILKEGNSSRSQALLKTLKSCMVGICVLATVYIALISVASQHAQILIGVPKDQLLAFLARHIMGEQMSLIAVTAIVLACFTTSVALLLVYTDFLSKQVFQGPGSSTRSMATTLLITFVMSIFGLEGVTFLTQPILSVFYPSLIILIGINLFRAWREQKTEESVCRQGTA